MCAISKKNRVNDYYYIYYYITILSITISIFPLSCVFSLPRLPKVHCDIVLPQELEECLLLDFIVQLAAKPLAEKHISEAVLPPTRQAKLNSPQPAIDLGEELLALGVGRDPVEGGLHPRHLEPVRDPPLLLRPPRPPPRVPVRCHMHKLACRSPSGKVPPVRLVSVLWLCPFDVGPFSNAPF